MKNEIVLRDEGNTYCGALANKFACGRLTIPKVTRLSKTERYFVFEVTPTEIIFRAAQSTREGALTYCTSDAHTLIWRDEPTLAGTTETLMDVLVAHNGEVIAELHRKPVWSELTREWLGDDYSWELWTADQPESVVRFMNETRARLAFTLLQTLSGTGLGAEPAANAKSIV